MAWPCSLAAVALLAVSCSDNGRSAPSATSDGSRRPTPSPAPAVPMVYVAVGASDAVGYGADDPATDAWPQVLLRTALPPRSELVKLGIPGATVATAIERELPEALRRAPTLVTVWLNVNDLMAMVPVETYERRLGELVGALRRGGGGAGCWWPTRRLSTAYRSTWPARATRPAWVGACPAPTW